MILIVLCALVCGYLVAVVGIKVLQQHDDCLLHPPDDFTQWPDDGDDER